MPSHPHQFLDMHLSTFIIQEYKTTQSNLSCWDDSLLLLGCSPHKRFIPAFFGNTTGRAILNMNALIARV